MIPPHTKTQYYESLKQLLWTQDPDGSWRLPPHPHQPTNGEAHELGQWLVVALTDTLVSPEEFRGDCLRLIALYAPER